MVVAGVVATALLTHTPGDPSWNTASDADPVNALGRFGATLSDAALQGFGLAAVLPLLAVLSWGVRLISGQQISAAWLRTVGLIAAAILLSFGLAALPKPPEWPIAAGLGGAAGALLLRFTQQISADSAGMVAGLGGLTGAVLFLWAAHVRFDEWRRAIASLRAMPDTVLGLGGKARQALNRPRKDRTDKTDRDTSRDRDDDGRPRRRRVEPAVTTRTEPVLGTPQPAPARTEPAVEVVTRPRPPAPSRREMEARQGSLLPPDPAVPSESVPPEPPLPPEPAEPTEAGS